MLLKIINTPILDEISMMFMNDTVLNNYLAA